MSKKTKMIAYIDCVLLFACAIVNILPLLTASTALVNRVTHVFRMANAFVAIVYLLSGAKKGFGTKLYRVFMTVTAVTQLQLYQREGFSVMDQTLVALEIAVLALLTFSMDFGEKKSKIAGFVLVCCEAAMIIAEIVTGISVENIASMAAGFVTALTVLLLIFAKYEDKKARYGKAEEKESV